MERDLDRELEEDSKGDFRGDFKQDLHGQDIVVKLRSGPGQVWSSLGLVQVRFGPGLVQFTAQISYFRA